MTEEQEKQVNHFLTLFIGGCFHEPNRNSGAAKCIHCKKWIDMDDIKNLQHQYNPDFYQPNDFHRLMKWMEENEPVLWEEYLYNYLYYVKGKSAGKRFNSVLDPSNLFEFLKEHREDWEWVTVGYDSCTTLPQREQHPAAVYLDSL